ncbi:hypothetical protein [Pontibacter litorisediminis]|uniref:hypothetical protein n=1 Tax=Pontibacter litorisediminis TaxID=1846260 RepID=UPI0023ED4896|nr:hypothetical protein [Pontibacter litorisediminis]
MKDQKKKSLEFHGFASNPEKSFEAGRKGNRLAIENSLRGMGNTGSNTQAKPAPSAGESNNHQGRPAKGGKGWQSVSNKADSGSSEE